MKTHARVILEFVFHDVKADPDTAVKMDTFAKNVRDTVVSTIMLTKALSVTAGHKVQFEQEVPAVPPPKGEKS